MKLPPHNPLGKTVPHNHEEIQPTDGVIRRISAHQIVQDNNLGKRRVSTVAVRPSSGPDGGMSLDIEALIVKAGIDPKAYVTTPKWMGSIKFEVKTLRDQALLVGFDPIASNPYHGQAWGDFSRTVQKNLLQSAIWYVEIDDVALG